MSLKDVQTQGKTKKAFDVYSLRHRDKSESVSSSSTNIEDLNA